MSLIDLLITLVLIQGVNYDVQPKTEDIQAEAINEYLTDYHSNYNSIGGELVRIGGTNSVDPYLLTALFVLESSGGKQCFNGYNCLGYGRYRYDDVLDCFEDVAEALGGSGVNGVYYKNKPMEERISIYNGRNPTYYPRAVQIIKDIKAKEVN